ncbi:MAG: DUF1963 domain-containing protein [Paludibacteraceae bacterium]|nr:DUF1963 domain-containing protein [Paludibacteraceae bacterium]
MIHSAANRTSDSHWWGFASMPEGMQQPYNGDDNPLTLVCQFRLGEGLIYVFADLDYFFGDTEVDGGRLGEWDERFYRVLYSPTRENLREHAIRYADGTSAVPEPQALDAPSKRGEESYVLHLPTVWMDELAQDYPGYDVLLQLDECEDIGLRFYDCGTLFFLIKPEDLAARRFDGVKCVLYSY